MLPPTHAKKELLYYSHTTRPLILLKKKKALFVSKGQNV